MKYYWKAWKWENGGKSTELTEYLTMPIFIEPHLDETLGTGEIILDGVPKTQNIAFPPKTKIRIERYLTKDFSDNPTTFDFIVDSDQVEEYVGCPEICCHRIELIEPSAVAQGMHVDNISLTRELNDVDLNYKTTITSTNTVSIIKNEIIGSGYERPNLTYGTTGRNGTGWYKTLSSGSYKFTNSFRYIWSNTSSIDNLLQNLNGLLSHEVSFTIPTLTCYHLNQTVPDLLFECPIRTKVIRTTMQNNQPVSGTDTEVVNHFYNPVNIRSSVDYVMYNESGKAGLIEIKNENYEDDNIGSGSSQAMAVFFKKNRLSKYPAMINTNDTSHTSKTITFNTSALSQTEIDNGKSYRYTITCTIEPYESGAIVQEFTKTCTLDYKDTDWWVILISLGLASNAYAKYSVTQNSLSKPASTSITLSSSFYAKDMLSDAQPAPFLVKSQKYSCFNLIRKALLTIDTQIIDNEKIGLDPLLDENYNDIGIQYPIDIDSKWLTKLKETQLHETIFENKNLWEIFLQVGYYLHAIPQLTFARDGSDRFLLSFRQLGGNQIKNNDSTKITIFNSQNLSEYYTQLDSYVKNIFSPQNEVEEWLVCKTTDSTYLVSNNTAELQTKYNITQIDEFDIEYEGQTQSALNYIFEKTIYNTLTSETGVIPGKWAAIYYEMGTNKIQGLNYVPPEVNAGDNVMALKKICSDLFGMPTGSLTAEDFLYNKLKFHIKYKTQDELRISQFKPNLYNFLKNSKFEKYPKHEQYYGQEDKIVDSERFSANLWGRLVRIANGIYQCNEYAEIGEEKEVGDLVEINNSLYYVTSIEGEYYNDIILQKVTYSKNFNQISQVVTIPSEPRYYEISERSMVRREVRLMDFLLLTTKQNNTQTTPLFINTDKWKDFVKKIIFTEGGQPELPNFAYTRFKADKIRQHLKANGEIVNYKTLFPNSETEKVEGVVTPKANSDCKDVIVPLLHFPLRNAIVFEWDMDDNFKAGDAVDIKTSGKVDITDEAFYTLLPVRYCDVMGGADLFSFKLFNKTDWTQEQIQRLPLAESEDFVPTESDSLFLLTDKLSIGLDKDNREALSFNYQINLLTSDDDEENKFIIFSNIFGQKFSRLKMVLINHTVSMFDEAVDMSINYIVADNVDYSLIEHEGAIEVSITKPEGINIDEVKAIVLYDQDGGLNYAYLAKNVDNLTGDNKLQSWFIYPVFTE